MTAISPLLKVQHDFEIDGGRAITGSLSIQGTPDEVFDALIAGYRTWCTAKKSEHSKFQVFIHARSKDPSHPVLLRYLIGRWNEVQKPTCPGLVEVWVGSNAQSWYGFTNGTYPDDPVKRTQVVRYVTYEEMESSLAAVEREREERQRKERRSNSVRNPIQLPATIRAELARYLKLEFPKLEEARLTARHMRFVGEVRIDGVPTQFWRAAVPIAPPPWGIVERFEDHYELSFAEELPPELRGAEG